MSHAGKLAFVAKPKPNSDFVRASHRRPNRNPQCLRPRPISINAKQSKVVFNHPLLPEFIPDISIKNLTVGVSRVDLTLRHYKQDVSVDIDQRDGSVEVVVVK